jgi:hypothetical protein
MKKPYAKPAIILSLRIEARAVECAKANDVCSPIGPLTS